MKLVSLNNIWSLPTMMLIPSKIKEHFSKINYWMTKIIMSTTCILIIDWLKNVLFKSIKIAYHSVTFNRSKKQSHNTAYGFEQSIYDRNGHKNDHYERVLWNDNEVLKTMKLIWQFKYFPPTNMSFGIIVDTFQQWGL